MTSKTRPKKLGFFSFALFLSLTLLSHDAGAVLTYWDPTGLTGNANSSGIWENNNWSTVVGGTATPGAFVEGTAALFSAGVGATNLTFIVTANSAHSVAGIFNGGVAGAKSGNVTINGPGVLSIASGLQGFLTTNGANTTINAVLGGTGGLQNQNGGSLFLYGNNTYSGGTSLDTSAGLNFNNNNSFGTGAITWAVGTTVLATPANDGFGNTGATGPITIANSVTTISGTQIFVGIAAAPVTFSGPWTLPASGTSTFQNQPSGTAVTISGVISGAAAFTKAGAGALTMSGVNTYTGATTISAGSLTIGGAGQLNSGTYAGNITDNAALVYNSSANQTLSGVISGTGTLTEAGSGSLTLNGVNTYTGNTTISGGSLIIGAAGKLGNGTYAGAVANSTSLNYNSSASTTISGIISGSGAINVGSGTLILSGANTYSGKTTVTGGTLTINTSGDAALGTAPASYVADQLSLSGGTFSLGSAANATLSANRGITLTGGNTIALSSKDLTIPGNIVGVGSLTKSGANTVTLAGTNTFAGNFTVLGGGVNFNGNDTAGHGNVIVGPTTAAVTLRNTVAASTVTNNITINGGGTSDIDTFATTGDSLTYSGTISGAGLLLRGKGGGAGNIVITGSNTNFSGGITVLQGPLVIGNANALGTGTFTVGPGSVAVSVSANTPLTGANAVTNSFNIACTNKTFTIGGSSDLEFAGPINLGSTAGATSASVTVTNTGATIFSGPISGPAGIGLTNGGAGTLTVSGSANTYTGPTVVNGNLKVTGNITSSSGVTVNNGGTLSGPGMVPAFAINTGGVISPGSSPGTISTGSGTLAGGGHYKWEINLAGGSAGTDPGWDRINVSGGLNITATAGSPFVIDVTSLTSGDVAGSVSDFDNTTNYLWSIATTASGITNFDASEFTVTTAGFANSLGNGGFYVTNNATDILLGFNQKPTITDLEPVNPSVNALDSVTFTVTANGIGTLAYQWRKGGVVIPGATNSTFSIPTVHGTDAGTYDVLVSNFAGATASVGDVLTVVPLSQTITFNPIANQTYGASVNLNPTASSGLTVSLSVLSGPATLTGNTLKVTGVGPVSVQASQPGNSDYSAASNVVQNFTANPATLTVSADAKFRPFGATNPVLTVTYTNFANGETLGTSDVVGSPVLTVGADTNSDAGSYVITNSVGTLASTNYTFNLVNGTLTITNAVSSNAFTVDVNPALPGSNVTFTATLSTLAPSLAVPTNAVQLVIDGTNVGSPVFPTNGVATFTNNSISHGNHTVATAYGGDTNSLGATNILGSTNSLVELINTPPVAGPASYGRPRDIQLMIPVANLLTNASDADGDTLSLLSVGAVSTNGATIVLTNGVVSYTAPTNNGNVTDTFTYTVSDTFGATNGNIVTVTILPDDGGPSVNITGLTTLGDGTALISFAGIPNRNYLIQATTNLSPPISWATIATNTAGTNGLFQYNDLNSTNFSSRYYRTAKP